MIVVDSSALMAIALNEGDAVKCEAALLQSETLLMSAAIYAEVLVVAQGKGCAGALRALIEALAIEIIPADDTTAEQVAFAYKAWGKGRHKAALNLMDCFSYVTAKTFNCPLLFVGDDFSQTDIESAL